ncbi:hypothetical protein [Natrialbaceae archaeon AArc-T1-2]|uniref:hypothetical protein n=1 Tax=Natrialbaceae archaeon AArc-T1-2 TaxID=3053904 RepID=UPI00255B3A5E|nr:hypothetical protein [Natrialbaceae archaeon AArc-T1-2]WIV66372.1 hypothetical protein QQ977_11815 [Natrialbaceae archaeon AArc-T1-2]
MSEPDSDTEGETITLHELLERSARAALELQREDGSFPPGRNGVYDEPETPVRTTSHWLTTLSKVYEITGDEVFAEAANDAADYLLSDEARPYGYTFHSRTVEGKDHCDGLVGQAAPVRGLAHAGPTLGRPELLETAKDVVLLHPFDEGLGLWERVEIDGSVLSFDRTLNHQILFAGAASHLAEEHEEVENTVTKFTAQLESNICLHDDGIIKHYIRPPFGRIVRTVLQEPRHWRLLANDVLSRLYSYSPSRKQKEIGYHPVNLLGLAQLKLNLAVMGLWSDLDTELPIEEICATDTTSQVAEYDGHYGAMTPGIDIALALQVLCDADTKRVQQWLERDFQEKFDVMSNLLSAGTTNSVFQAAAITYVVNLSDYNIRL